VVRVNNPVGGNALSAPFSGRVTFGAPQSTVKGLPNSASRTLKAGKPVTATVTVRNEGPASEDLFLDPRLAGRSDYSLLGLTPTTTAIPIPGGTNPPLFLMVPQTNQVTAAAQATEPVTFDWGFGDPHLVAASAGNTASGRFNAGEVPDGIWFIAPDPIGPFNGPATPGQVSTGMVAHTRTFDVDSRPSTGDIWEEAVNIDDGGFAPTMVAPGKKATMTVTITPSGRKGRTVRGTLFVDSFSSFLLSGNELLAIPYEYTVG
jgi:hypothetical protein